MSSATLDAPQSARRGKGRTKKLPAPGLPRTFDDGTALYPSASRPLVEHFVSVDKDGIVSCSCESFRLGHQFCDHARDYTARLRVLTAYPGCEVQGSHEGAACAVCGGRTTVVQVYAGAYLSPSVCSRCGQLRRVSK